MKTKNLVSILLLIAVAVMIAGSNVNLVKASDKFNGVITNINLSPQIFEGIGVYDHNCKSVENGLTECDAGIQTSFGLINFNYKHNMKEQPCIDEGDNLSIAVFEGGSAIITRK